jgi:hypothetical protein
MPSKEPKNLMDEEKKDTPPAQDVRWEVSCNARTRTSREDKGEISRHVKVIVYARTWVDARERAFRAFASEHQIYEPEDVEAFVLRDAMPKVPVTVPMPEAGAPPPPRVDATVTVKKGGRKKTTVKEETP